jgi:hypothetical protein
MPQYITAKEARELILSSDNSIEKFMETISDGIRKNFNVRSYEVMIPDLYVFVEKFKVDFEKISPVQRIIISKLQGLGFSVSFGQLGDSYIPRGLADDYDSSIGPQYANCGITVRW